MPELPEVETTKRGLAPHLSGHTITQVVVREARLRWPVAPEVTARLPGAQLHGISRRGKYLLFETSAGCVIVHLGMSGSLRLIHPAEPAARHDHIDWVFDHGLALRLRDPRRFGAMLWGGDTPLGHSLLANLGMEPMTAAFSAEYFFLALRKRAAPIKQVLMDSHVVVGVGNIYANEALFRAGIRPTTAARRLSRARVGKLATAVDATLIRAIKAGGSSLRDFLRADGTPGNFQLDYAVYGRAGKPCKVCKGAIKLIRQGQRATFYCPNCQK